MNFDGDKKTSRGVKEPNALDYIQLECSCKLLSSFFRPLTSQSPKQNFPLPINIFVFVMMRGFPLLVKAVWVCV